MVTKNEKLKSAINTAQDATSDYYRFIDKMEDIASAAYAGQDSGYDDEPKASQKPSNNIGQQNVSVENIINDVLKRIDKRQAGEIRNIVAKSANKLATLQRELDKRGINPIQNHNF